nr:LLM class F420-dependent oxidoreductase [Myxococcota bacterium]
PEPRIVAGLQIVLTGNPEAVRERLTKRMAIYSQLPSYRAMLDEEGARHPVELALLGDERALDAGLDRLRDLGVSDLEAVVVPAEAGAEERTLQYLEGRAATA